MRSALAVDIEYGSPRARLARSVSTRQCGPDDGAERTLPCDGAGVRRGGPVAGLSQQRHLDAGEPAVSETRQRRLRRLPARGGWTGREAGEPIAGGTPCTAKSDADHASRLRRG